MNTSAFAVAVSTLLLAGSAAADLVVPMDLVNDQGAVRPIGTVSISATSYGLVFSPALEGLPHGVHGFHVHENPSCAPRDKDGKSVPALAAGGHYDPAGSKKHGTPWGDGHLGDLPGLVVDHDGKAGYAVLAPRLKLDDVKNRSLMIHVGGDNHSDHPAPLGGGGARLACGVIKG